MAPTGPSCSPSTMLAPSRDSLPGCQDGAQHWPWAHCCLLGIQLCPVLSPSFCPEASPTAPGTACEHILGGCWQSLRSQDVSRQCSQDMKALAVKLQRVGTEGEGDFPRWLRPSWTSASGRETAECGAECSPRCSGRARLRHGPRECWPPGTLRACFPSLGAQSQRGWRAALGVTGNCLWPLPGSAGDSGHWEAEHCCVHGAGKGSMAVWQRGRWVEGGTPHGVPLLITTHFLETECSPRWPGPSERWHRAVCGRQLS